jgi:hypothetical protein
MKFVTHFSVHPVYLCMKTGLILHSDFVVAVSGGGGGGGSSKQ